MSSQNRKTSKNVVKYDPLKRIFLGRFSYVRTEIYTNLRSYSVSIILTYICIRTCILYMSNLNSFRLREVEIFKNITWNFQLVDPTSGWSKFQKNFRRSPDFIALNICVISECPRVIWERRSRSDGWTDGRTDIMRTIVHFSLKNALKRLNKFSCLSAF